MPRPRLLDLFCGAGGCSVGYNRAGFDVVGVDIAPQPRYPFEFHQADALEFPLDGYDAIHASPPCQAYTHMSNRWRGKGGVADQHPELIADMRNRLVATGLPYVIENVVGSDLAATLLLHGGMFGLGVHRPRLFESNVLLLAPRSPRVIGAIGVYGARPDGRWLNKTSPVRAASSINEASEAMGINWMTWDEIREAIPPAYTQWIGEQLLEHITREVA